MPASTPERPGRPDPPGGGLPRLYGDLADWWPLLSAPAEYAEEAGRYLEVMRATSAIPVRELLELGSGGGNTASHLAAHLDLTLVDLAPAMLEVSRRLNPGCTHVEGDMRTVRLGRSFDAVLVHDAVDYLTTPEDLFAAMTTAAVHCRPGGVALFVPDHVRETFTPSTSHGGHDGDGRSLRYLEWTHAPDPGGTTYMVDFAILLREGSTTRVEHDRHVCGLFGRALWLDLLDRAGFAPHEEAVALSGGEVVSCFAGRRRGHDSPT
ncbi:MAG: class I SAM-dependent methyltransferase [Acidimicrobiia bacterium]|nr:class I SAM-dependent methyltransferase [Acidimicrobiia bacterium]